MGFLAGLAGGLGEMAGGIPGITGTTTAESEALSGPVSYGDVHFATKGAQYQNYALVALVGVALIVALRKG
jgi:hypothetical protein